VGVLCCAWKAFYDYHGLEGIKEMTFLNTVRCRLCVCASAWVVLCVRRARMHVGFARAWGACPPPQPRSDPNRAANAVGAALHILGPRARATSDAWS
jgi:hypothetical protein